MKRSNKTVWISLAILLVGCNSFNRYEIKDDSLTHPFLFSLQQAKHEGDEKKFESMTKQGCPVFVMPKLPEQPALPYAKISKLRPGENDAVDTVYSEYIAELRKHNRTVFKILTEAYGKYVQECNKSK